MTYVVVWGAFLDRKFTDWAKLDIDHNYSSDASSLWVESPDAPLREVELMVIGVVV